jgi:septin family protein
MKQISLVRFLPLLSCADMLEKKNDIIFKSNIVKALATNSLKYYFFFQI